jgi:hypothetical protein
VSTFFRVIAVLLVVAVAIGIGTGVYNAGVSAGFAEAAQQAAASGDPIPLAPYGPGYGQYWHGFGGFGFLWVVFWILGIFLVIGLVRAAFGWGRWGGGPGGTGRHGAWGDRRQRLEELHRELHRAETPNGERPAGA